MKRLGSFGTNGKNKVLKLFAECGNDSEAFIKRYSLKKEHEKETELGVFFAFLTEEEIADRPETLS